MIKIWLLIFKKANKKYENMDKQKSIFFLRKEVEPNLLRKFVNFVFNGK